MPITRTTNRASLALAAAIPALALLAPAEAQAQSVSRVEQQIGATRVETSTPITTPPLGDWRAPATSGATGVATPLPNEMALSRDPSFSEERFVGPDGVETIVRTRRIYRSPPTPSAVQPEFSNAAYPVVFERDQWLSECNRRTTGRSEKEKGGIIGSLLGAIGGGIAGNLIAGAGERLAGTLIGAGTGGLAGLLLGSLIGGGKKGDRYDCEAALNGYIAQYGQPGATRVIYPAAPAGFGYAYSGQYGYSSACGCQQPQMVLVPIRRQVRQRVIVTEKETIQLIPGEPITPPIPPQRPSPKMIKQ